MAKKKKEIHADIINGYKQICHRNDVRAPSIWYGTPPHKITLAIARTPHTSSRHMLRAACVYHRPTQHAFPYVLPTPQIYLLVHLDAAEDLLHEPERREVAAGAGDEEEDDGQEQHVGDVDEGGHAVGDVRLPEVVPHGEEQHVDARGARRGHARPPPSVVRRAELEVAHDDAELGAGDHEDDHGHHEEAEDVVELVQPHGAHEEEELHGHGAEGEDAAHGHDDGGLEVPRLLRDLPRDEVHPAGQLHEVLAVTRVAAGEDERHAHAEPHPDEREPRQRRHGCARALRGEGHVHHEEADEAQAGEGHGGEQRGEAPVGAAEHLVGARRVVAGDGAQERVEEEQRGHEVAAVRRAHDAEDGDGERREDHERQLDARAHDGGEGHLAVRGRAEDLGVHELPARVLLVGVLVVRGDVAA
mmetsp:Transcript_22900/g.71110  ORF Transcript_22900/g.71110 Transcript_22900/m.71110 type:complete len:416 (-) Transcript_22900:979-2226(-)